MATRRLTVAQVKGTNTSIRPLSWRSSVSSDIIGRGLHPLLHRTLPGPQSSAVLPTIQHDKDVELMVLRHQVRVLERQLHVRVRYRRVDWAILATLNRPLARLRWRCFLVTPQTLLRWHRELSKRRWKRWRRQRGVGHQYLDRRPELAVFSTSDHDRLWPSRPVTSACAGSSACADLWRLTARGAAP